MLRVYRYSIEKAGLENKMHFHIGNRDIISKSKIIGIFSAESIFYSDLNNNYTDKSNNDIKSVIVDESDAVLYSIVSSNTLIDRYNTIKFDDCLYQRSK